MKERINNKGKNKTQNKAKPKNEQKEKREQSVASPSARKRKKSVDSSGGEVGMSDDATGDGLPDLLVGMPYSDLRNYDAGAVAVLSGPTALSSGRLSDDQVSALLHALVGRS